MQSLMNRVLMAGLLVWCCSVVPAAVAEEVSSSAEEAAASAMDATAGAQGQMSEEEMMAAWAAAATPGEHHAVLAQLVGTFDTVVTYQMSPDAPVETSEGVSTNTMILGGRFLQNSHEGMAMGMPYQGLGMTGYDNLAEQYVSTWADTMGTLMVVARGAAGDEPGVLNLDVEPFLCPMTGMHKKAREVWTIHSPDHYTLEWFEVQPDGSEFRGMVIEYTRAPEATPEVPEE